CRRGSVAVISTQKRRATDATGIEQPLVRAAVDDDVAVQREAVQPCPFDEERATLTKERLERTQIQHGGICLDLPEIRIHSRIDGYVRRKPQLQISPGSDALRLLEATGVSCPGRTLRHRVG